MIDQAGQDKLLESLRSLLQRLEAPDLTLPEAKALRFELLRYLGESESLAT
jgi:hypothetical protein